MWDDAERRRFISIRGAVPSVIPKLPLALVYSELSAVTDARHVVLVELTEADLPRRKHIELVADRNLAEPMKLRVPPGIELFCSETPANVNQCKCMFLYGAVSSPYLFIPAPTRLFWEEFSHAVITVGEDYSLTFPSLSIAMYSFKQLSERRCRGENENRKHRNGSKGDSYLGFLDCESGIRPLNYT